MIDYTFMDPINFKTALSDSDLLGILKLQQENHIHSLNSLDQGFLYVLHSFEDLKKMNDFAPHVIGMGGDAVAAYVLAMTVDCKEDVPVLIPMFDLFEKIDFKGKKISEYQYLVVGQVCVGQHYRGNGIFDKGYQYYRDTFKQDYDFAITEVSTRNHRSLKAHQRVGFTEIHRYTDPLSEEWSIVLWDWK
ncbi:Acetyltransferase (GNAT) family protein [Rhodonellum ikkaensis]|nr:Acetyltransferase (GNAT) family protein [Rhodonellum ikkaensis]